MKKLHVVCAITNPCRYESRTRLHQEFEQRVIAAGAEITTIEAAFGQRAHLSTEAGNPRHIQLRTQHELWHKENLLNLAISRVDAEYVAWIDADVEFMRPDWAEETVEQLQHYEIVQMFSHAIDLGPQRLGFPVVQMHKGFMSQYLEGKPYPYHDGQCKYEHWHPGFAWAARRSALDKMEGLLDWTLLGAADHMMSLGLIGKMCDALPGGLHPNYKNLANRWQALAEAQIKRNVGFVPGTLKHYWHGKKADRQYESRWKILQDTQYDPLVDILKDTRGVLRLADNKPELRDRLRRYNRTRYEDSQEL